MLDAVTHPSLDELAAFGLGKLDGDAATTVANHLAACETCHDAVAKLPGDSFVNLVKAARPEGEPTRSYAGTPLPADTLQGAPPPSLSGLPPELAAHPKYRVVAELGRGGMGVVYKAEHRVMGRFVAIKVINKALLDRTEVLERFRREVKAAAQLTHPNIVTAFDAEPAGDLHLLVMEYVEGTSLSAVVERRGRLPVVHACNYVRQAALGLQHAFEQGMVHRDIKPHNLMLTTTGRVKILDFGLARMVSERTQDHELTVENVMMGTPAYMSPEQGNDAHSADIRADIYSLGCTLYCLLAGEPPFAGGSAMHVIFAHKHLQAKPLHEINPEVPPRLSDVVATMMAKEPGRRFQKPAEVAQALAPFCKTATVTTEKPRATDAAETPVVRWDELTYSTFPPLPPLGNPVARPRRRQQRHRGMVALGLVFVCLLGLLGGVLLLKTKYGTIVLENVPEQAEVTLDGEAATLKTADGNKFEIRVVAGRKHRLQVRKDGFKVFGREIEIDAGGSKPITVRLEPLPAAPSKPLPPAETVTASCHCVLQGHENPVVRVLFTPDGSRVVSASNGDHPTRHQNQMAYTAGADNSARVWKVESGQQVRKFNLSEGSRFGTQGLSISPDGKLLAVAASWPWGNSDSRAYVWDIASGERKQHFAIPGICTLRGVGFSADGSKVFVVQAEQKCVRAWFVSDGTEVPILRFDDPVKGISSRMTATVGSRYVLGGAGNPYRGGGIFDDANGDFRVWNLSNGKIVRTFTGHKKTMAEIVMSPDETRVLSCAQDYSVRLWDASSGQEILCIGNLDSNVRCVAFSPDGKRFVAGSEDGTVRLFDTTTGNKLCRLTGHQGPVNGVAFSPNNAKLIASGSDDHSVRLWKIEDVVE